MGQVSVSLPADGSTIDAADYNTPINTLINDYNSNIDNSNIAAAAAIAGTKLADNSITNAKLATGAGEAGGAWTSWTPTLSGRFNNSKWTKTCTYTKVSRTVFFKMLLVANAATPMDGGTAEAIFTLPVTSINYVETAMPIISTQTRILDAGTAVFYGTTEWIDTTTAQIRLVNAAGTYTTPTAITSAVPMTWASTDQIFVFGFYEASA